MIFIFSILFLSYVNAAVYQLNTIQSVFKDKSTPLKWTLGKTVPIYLLKETQDTPNFDEEGPFRIILVSADLPLMPADEIEGGDKITILDKNELGDSGVPVNHLLPTVKNVLVVEYEVPETLKEGKYSLIFSRKRKNKKDGSVTMADNNHSIVVKKETQQKRSLFNFFKGVFN